MSDGTYDLVFDGEVLDGFDRLKICVGYKLGEDTIDYFPGSIATLERCQPVYEELPGWQAATSDIRRYEQLPMEARQYIARLEELVSCPAALISVGQEREQTIEVTSIL